MGLSRAVSVETIALLILGRIGEGRFSVGHAALGHIRVGIIGVRHHRPGPMPRPAHPARSQLEFAGTCFAGTRVNSADHAAARCSPKCDRLSVADSLSPTAVELAGMPPQKNQPAPTSQAAGNPKDVRSAAANRPRGATPPGSRTARNRRPRNPPEPRHVTAARRNAA